MAKTQKKSKKKMNQRKQPDLSTREIEALMGMNRPTYNRYRGTWRQK
ncbi:hypothetical protein [Alkalihalobacillus pseudalcaliphilus]|nr:hypothetical protein [Alkalihalobacillus pseudalcaliphilus]